MEGVLNRLPNVMCEVGTCLTQAAVTEYVTVIPGDAALTHERHQIDIVLCRRHGSDFHRNGLIGTITAYGDTVVGTEQRVNA